MVTCVQVIVGYIAFMLNETNCIMCFGQVLISVQFREVLLDKICIISSKELLQWTVPYGKSISLLKLRTIITWLVTSKLPGSSNQFLFNHSLVWQHDVLRNYRYFQNSRDYCEGAPDRTHSIISCSTDFQPQKSVDVNVIFV